MSRNEWEEGTIKLPTADFARIRKAVQETDAQVRTKALAHTQSFWKGLTRKQQTDKDEYAKALWAWSRKQSPEGGSGWATLRRPDPVDKAAVDEAYSLLQRRTWSARPTRVQASEVGMPTNRTTTFHAGEATISFDRATSSVTWHVEENNHAVEHARSSAVGQRLFGELDRTRWTRGTGGALTGNDEYNEDSREHGGGSNYHTGAYGPLGAVQAPTHTRPWTDPQGRRFDVETKVGRYGFVGKVVEVDARGNPVRRRRPSPGKAPTGPATSRPASDATPGVRGRHAAGSARGGQFASTAAPESDVELEQI